MLRTLKGLLVAASLAVTSSAFAIPMGVDILGGAGKWELSGPTAKSDTWLAFYHDSFDILPGEYLWSVTGGGIGGAIWSVSLGGDVVHSEGAGGIVFKIDDSYKFTVSRTSVPEPATLSLLGLGVLAAGFSMRRKRAAK